jgi:tetratricopeptide (TPR) repeat protein
MRDSRGPSDPFTGFSPSYLRLAFGVDAFMMAIAQTALAQLHITCGDLGQALSAAQQALTTSLQCRAHLEEGAAHRVLGQIYEAMDNRDEADAAFRRSLEILGEIQSRPELAQTLLAYGRFRRGDNSLEDRALIERALRLFEELGTTGWIVEARAALAAARKAVIRPQRAVLQSWFP